METIRPNVESKKTIMWSSKKRSDEIWAERKKERKLIGIFERDFGFWSVKQCLCGDQRISQFMPWRKERKWNEKNRHWSKNIYNIIMVIEQKIYSFISHMKCSTETIQYKDKLDTQRRKIKIAI